jgi:release factor glutamine methyltransferase
MTTVDELIAQARAGGMDRLDAQLLVSHRLARPRAWLLAHGDASVPEDTSLVLARDFAERRRGVPLAYLIGEREFHGLMLRVTPDVLVPRPDTEVLVDWALELLAGPLAAEVSPAIADLGTGSGAIAVSIKQACPRAQVLALDASPAALAVARANAARHGLAIETVQGDWLRGIGPRHFHLLLSNPPYIDGDDPHLLALHAEPALALTPGADGLAALYAIVGQAPPCLHEDGWLLLEHGHTQATAVAARLTAAGFEQVRTRRDLAGNPRCTGGRWTPRPGASI